MHPNAEHNQSNSELVSTSEVARMLDISTRRVLQLMDERPDFPRPAHQTPGTRRGVGTRRWRRQDVEHWRENADRRPGRRWPS